MTERPQQIKTEDTFLKKIELRLPQNRPGVNYVFKFYYANGVAYTNELMLRFLL